MSKSVSATGLHFFFLNIFLALTHHNPTFAVFLNHPFANFTVDLAIDFNYKLFGLHDFIFNNFDVALSICEEILFHLFAWAAALRTHIYKLRILSVI